MADLYKINKNDNVAVALKDLKKGTAENGIILKDDIPFGHKILLCDLPAGSEIIKYSNRIGYLKKNCYAGEHIHSHNLKTALNSKNIVYTAPNTFHEYNPLKTDDSFLGYDRGSLGVGIRNEIWIIPTVGCVNKLCEKIKENSKSIVSNAVTDVKVFSHPYGCSQMGEDSRMTSKILASLVSHPNAAGVLVVSLGCENNNLENFKPLLGDYDENRVKFLVAQNEEDEISKGVSIIKKLSSFAETFEKKEISADRLVVGLKCGGSDAFSGITANALCGQFTDKITSFGASAVLTEVPEMFGAETILLNRATDISVFNQAADLINSFKNYFESRNQVCYENPSPGNKEGGITTLEEKSLGCIQKGGQATVTGVIPYAEKCKSSGLNLLYSPGNDIVSATALTAAGAHLVLFTTGRGTPLGAPVPTIKIASNTPLFERKKKWIDFNAGTMIDNSNGDECEKLYSLVLETASGKKTKNEENGYFEFAVLKDGVTM